MRNMNVQKYMRLVTISFCGQLSAVNGVRKAIHTTKKTSYGDYHVDGTEIRT